MLRGNEINTDENQEKTPKPRESDRFGENEETDQSREKEIARLRDDRRLNARRGETQGLRIATPHEDIGENEENDVDNGQEREERRFTEG